VPCLRFAHHPGDLLPSLARQLEHRAGDLSAKNLAVAAHALAKLQVAATAEVQALLHAIAAQSVISCSDFSPQVRYRVISCGFDALSERLLGRI